MNNIFSLQNKVIVFLGGYGYLAVPIVKQCFEYGAKVIVLGRNQEKFDSAYDKQATFIKCDATNSNDVKSSLHIIEERFGKIDVFINGTYGVKSVQPESINDEDWQFSINASLNAYHNAIREVVPYMKKNGSGKIINFSSMYGVNIPDFDVYKDFPNFINPPHYGVAKAGVVHLTKYYASYLGQYNIQVNAVSPGPFPSDAVQENSGFVEKLKEKTVLKRIGKPADLVGVFVLLCSDSSNYITGQNFIVDGGWTIKG